MSYRWIAALVVAPLCALVACVGGTTPAAKSAPVPTEPAGLTERELERVGFDEVTITVTIAECVDSFVRAVQENRERPGDPRVIAQLSRSGALYLNGVREAEVRRWARKASCLPPVR